MLNKLTKFIRNHGGYFIGHLPGIRQAIVAVEDLVNKRGLPTALWRQSLARAIHQATGNSTFYLDYENGSDANNGSTWALAWKTITAGATAARIAPGDIIRIAKSSAPTSIGNATWNNLSKTVTLASIQTLNIDLCEVAWTEAGDTTVALTPVATDAKEGSNCMKLTLDTVPQVSIKQAYYQIADTNFSAYQKISFWIKNSAVIVANNWKVCLCSDTVGDVVVDTFYITAIPSTVRWIPLTLTKDGGGNLGATIQSIAIYTDTVAPTASSNILVDDFVACSTAGLNLQSLISKNSLEQGGTEGWYGIQSINGTTILLDTDTNMRADAGRGYSGTTELVATYKRETIKTALVSFAATAVQTVQDSGTLENNIQFQGGWNTSTTIQDGETFFDGLNGNGYGLNLSSKSYITFNYLNVCRYNSGVYYNASNNNTITTLTNANNNTLYGVYYNASNNNTITTLTNANNNNSSGVYYYSISNNNTITTLTNANNNAYGVYYNISNNNTITTLTNANNNAYGVSFSNSNNNTIKYLSTSGNGTAGIYNNNGVNYIFNPLIVEATEVSGYVSFANSRIFSHKHDQTTDNHWIFTDGGTINSQIATRHTAAGIAWRLAITSANRALSYPLNLSIAKIAVSANNLVTVKVWVYKNSAAGVGAKLICKGKQIAGVDSDVVATAADVLQTWEELAITFTPTEAGVVEIEGWGYYVSAVSNVYFDDMTITQA